MQYKIGKKRVNNDILFNCKNIIVLDAKKIREAIGLNYFRSFINSQLLLLFS
jgi:hypothetical protein